MYLNIQEKKDEKKNFAFYPRGSAKTSKKKKRDERPPLAVILDINVNFF